LRFNSCLSEKIRPSTASVTTAGAAPYISTIMKKSISETDKCAEIPGTLMEESFVNCEPTASIARMIHGLGNPA
jgi:hypothetical protein